MLSLLVMTVEQAAFILFVSLFIGTFFGASTAIAYWFAFDLLKGF